MLRATLSRAVPTVVVALALAIFPTQTAIADGVLPYVAGGGDVTPSNGVPFHFAVHALSGPQAVSGQITARLDTTPEQTIIAETSCLYIQGNRAVTGNMVTSDPTNPSLIGLTFEIAFVDNGGAVADQTSAAFGFGRGSPPPQPACVNAFATAFTTLFPISPGRVTVNAGAAWDPVADFRLFPNQTNPSPDSLGNPGVWNYMFSDNLAHDPTHYHLLPHYSIIDANREEWDSGDPSSPFRTPLVGHLAQGRLIVLHPFGGQQISFGHFAILAWRSPVAGTIDVNGNVFLGDFSCTNLGSGINWSIDNGSSSLLTSSLPSGGSLNFSLSTTVRVGDTLYFIVDPGFDSLCDSTDLSLLITKP